MCRICLNFSEASGTAFGTSNTHATVCDFFAVRGTKLGTSIGPLPVAGIRDAGERCTVGVGRCYLTRKNLSDCDCTLGKFRSSNQLPDLLVNRKKSELEKTALSNHTLIGKF
jgi:hypothetical protein